MSWKKAWQLEAFEDPKLNNCHKRLNILGIKIYFMTLWSIIHMCIFHRHNQYTFVYNKGNVYKRKILYNVLIKICSYLPLDIEFFLEDQI